MNILCLDASTTTIGLSVLRVDLSLFIKQNEVVKSDNMLDGIKLIHYDFFKPPHDEDIFKNLQDIRQYIKSKIDEFGPSDVCLEDIILFMKGHSTAATVSKLAVLNRTVGLAVRDFTGRSPALLNVVSVRHTIKLDKALPPKEDIPELVSKRLGIQFPWQYKVNRKTKERIAIVENYDIADSIAVGLAHIIKTYAYGQKKKQTTKQKTAKKKVRGKNEKCA